MSLTNVTAAEFPLVTVVDTYLDDFEADTFTGSGLSDRVTGDSGDTVNTGGGNDRINARRRAIRLSTSTNAEKPIAP